MSADKTGGEVNKIFQEATTSTAFVLMLSKRQCNELLRLSMADEWWKGHGSRMTTMRALEGKGLVSWRYENGKANGFEGLTEAGRLMVALLKEAGLTVENTNTAVTLRRAA
jgi:hypothetical protein